jgi:hypothetical protein
MRLPPHDRVAQAARTVPSHILAYVGNDVAGPVSARTYITKPACTNVRNQSMAQITNTIVAVRDPANTGNISSFYHSETWHSASRMATFEKSRSSIQKTRRKLIWPFTSNKLGLDEVYGGLLSTTLSAWREFCQKYARGCARVMGSLLARLRSAYRGNHHDCAFGTVYR